ncbi:MAG: transcription antitermination factor NusB [Bdellovibrionota bacterium]
MKSRHKAREIALQILYRYDVAQQSAGMRIPQGPALLQDLNHHFEHFDVASELREFSAQLVAGTLNQALEIDATIEKHASNWKVARMGFVDRSLIRMSTYELSAFPDTAASIVIDEAVELAKQFGTSDSPAFVNGILDAIKRESRG